MKVGDLIRVNLLNRLGGEPRRQLGVIIAFAALEKWQGCHIMLINGTKVSIRRERLELVE